MSSNQKRKPRTHRCAVRLAVFLKTKCFICFDDPDVEIPCSELGCCRKYAHESCLLSCFNAAYNLTGFDQRASCVPTCPHCRTQLILYHPDGIPPAELPGTGAFAFSYIQFTTCYNIPPISLVADKFENQCTPTRPFCVLFFFDSYHHRAVFDRSETHLFSPATYKSGYLCSGREHVKLCML